MNQATKSCSVTILVSTFLLLAFSSTCLAGAWTQKEGNSYNRFSANFYYSDEFFDTDGDRKDLPQNGDFRDYNLNYYMEFGLSDRLTLVTSLYYKYLKYEDDTLKSKSYGVSDIDLGMRYGISDNDLGVLSIQGLVKIPETYDEDDDVPLGNGEYEFEGRLLYGKSLWPVIPGYVNLEAAYRKRCGKPTDEFRYLAEFGVDFNEKIYGRIKLDGILSVEEDDAVFISGNNPSLSTETDLGKLDMTVGYKVSPKWSLEIGVRPEIYGENTSAGTNYSIAVAYTPN